MISGSSRSLISAGRRRYLLPAGLWAVFIIILLSLPGDRLPEWSFWKIIPFFDKVVHGVLFMILACLMLFGLSRQSVSWRLPDRAMFITLILGAVYAGLTEIIQMVFATGRSADVFDWLADVAGVITGILIFWSGYRIFVTRKAGQNKE